MIKKILTIFLLSVSTFIIFPGLVENTIAAPIASDIETNNHWPTSPLGTDVTVEVAGESFLIEGKGIPDVVQYFYEWMIVLAGLAVFIAFTWAGLLYLTSVGDVRKMGDAKKKIKKALIGLVLLMSSWLIFQIINPELVGLDEPTLGNLDGVVVAEEQERIMLFTETYMSCQLDWEINRKLTIHIPIPFIGLEWSIGELLDGFSGEEDAWEYTSFVDDRLINNECERLGEIIKNRGIFSFNIINADGEEERKTEICIHRTGDECEIAVNNYKDLIAILNFYRENEERRWWEIGSGGGGGGGGDGAPDWSDGVHFPIGP